METPQTPPPSSPRNEKIIPPQSTFIPCSPAQSSPRLCVLVEDTKDHAPKRTAARVLQFPPPIKKKRRNFPETPIYWGLTTMASPNFNPARLTSRQQAALIAKCEILGTQLDFSAPQDLSSFSPFVLDRIASESSEFVPWTQQLHSNQTKKSKNAKRPHTEDNAVLEEAKENIHHNVPIASSNSEHENQPQESRQEKNLLEPANNKNGPSTGEECESNADACQNIPYELSELVQHEAESLEPASKQSKIPMLPYPNSSFARYYQRMAYRRVVNNMDVYVSNSGACCRAVLSEIRRCKTDTDAIELFLDATSCDHRLVDDFLAALKEIFARDEKGRKRFHGAFTGGFTAGYHNTVGSKEGWQPSAYNRHANREERLLSIMDEEDMDDYSLQLNNVTEAPLKIIPIASEKKRPHTVSCPSLQLLAESNGLAMEGRISSDLPSKYSQPRSNLESENDELYYEDEHCYTPVALSRQADAIPALSQKLSIAPFKLEIEEALSDTILQSHSLPPEFLLAEVPGSFSPPFHECSSTELSAQEPILAPAEASAALASAYEPFASDPGKQKQYIEFLESVSKGLPVSLEVV